MNTDPRKSAQSCGCDEGANHTCAAHSLKARTEIRAYENWGEILVNIVDPKEGIHAATKDEATTIAFQDAPLGSAVFGTDAAARKGAPIFMGVLMYFPDALAAVARVSQKGNDQHNPGEPLHWAREKSTDQMDTATRHMVDHGTGYVKDEDGGYHLAKAAWRILAELQLTIEKERGQA